MKKMEIFYPDDITPTWDPNSRALNLSGAAVGPGPVVSPGGPGTGPGPTGPTGPTTPATTARIYTSYFTSGDLKAAVQAAKPAWQVWCDSDNGPALAGSGTDLPAIRFGSAENGETVNLMNPDHPYFLGVTNTGPRPVVVTVPPENPDEVHIIDGVVFPSYGPTVGTLENGQPIDAQGRTTGPRPKPAHGYESEIAGWLRLFPKYLPSGTYDGWGHRLSAPGTYTRLDPFYSSVDALLAAAKSTNYPQALIIKMKDGTTKTTTGFSPADSYAEQPDGTVVLTSG